MRPPHALGVSGPTSTAILRCACWLPSEQRGVNYIGRFQVDGRQAASSILNRCLTKKQLITVDTGKRNPLHK